MTEGIGTKCRVAIRVTSLMRLNELEDWKSLEPQLESCVAILHTIMYYYIMC